MITLIAEIGLAHEQDRDVIDLIISKAKEAGFDAIKLQYFTAENLEPPGAAREFIAKYETPLCLIEYTADHAHEAGLKFGVSLFNLADAVDYKDSPCWDKTDFLKLPSGQAGNLPLVRFVAEESIHDVVISTGMSGYADVATAASMISHNRTNGQISILHAVSSYPNLLGDMNMSAIRSVSMIADSCDCTMNYGWSAHTRETQPFAMAVALGVQVIEVHVCAISYKGPDWEVSWQDWQLPGFADMIRTLEGCMGSSILEPRLCELPAINAKTRREIWRSTRGR